MKTTYYSFSIVKSLTLAKKQGQGIPCTLYSPYDKERTFRYLVLDWNTFFKVICSSRTSDHKIISHLRKLNNFLYCHCEKELIWSFEDKVYRFIVVYRKVEHPILNVTSRRGENILEKLQGLFLILSFHVSRIILTVVYRFIKNVSSSRSH